MKHRKVIASTIVASMLVSNFSAAVFATENEPINIEQEFDGNSGLIDYFSSPERDANGDGYLSQEEIEQIEYLFIGDTGLTDVSKIYRFTNLRSLEISYNQLSSIDLSNFPNLTYLSCTNCGLESLDISGTELVNALEGEKTIYKEGWYSNPTVTYCAENPNDVDNPYMLIVDYSTEVYDNTKVYQHAYDSGADTECNVCSEIRTIPVCIPVDENTFPCDEFRRMIQVSYSTYIDGNYYLTETDTALTYMYLQFENCNTLKGIENFTNLGSLIIRGVGALEDNLDLSSLTSLNSLEIRNSEIDTIDVSSLTNLDSLYIHDTNIDSIDLSNNHYLSSFYYYDNNSKQVDISSNPYLQELFSEEAVPETDDGRIVNVYEYRPDEYSCYFGRLGYDVEVFSGEGDDRVVYQHAYDDYDDVTCNECEYVRELAEEVPINEVHFKDPNFREYLKEQFGESLSEPEIKSVTFFNLENKGITSLDGIGIFTNLQYLSCYNNNIEELDLSANTKLISLTCYNNEINSLILPDVRLTNLNCSNNKLTELTINPNWKLSDLSIYGNDIETVTLPSQSAMAAIVQEGKCTVYSNNEELYNRYTSSSYQSVAVDYDTHVVIDGIVYQHAYDNEQDADCNFECDDGHREIGDFIEITPELFEDENFRQYILDEIDDTHDGYLNESELNVTNMYLPEKEISTFKGIEIFKNLRNLSVYGNPVSEIDITGLDNIINAVTNGDSYYDSYSNSYNYNYSDGNGYYYVSVGDNTALSVNGEHIKHGYEDLTSDTCSCGYKRDVVAIAINEVNFPDDNLREEISHFDSNGDNILYGFEIEQIESLNLEDRGIEDLKGIELLPNLQYLYAYGNNLKDDIDLSDTSLVTADLSGNRGILSITIPSSMSSCLDGYYYTSWDMEDNRISNYEDRENNKFFRFGARVEVYLNRETVYHGYDEDPEAPCYNCGEDRGVFTINIDSAFPDPIVREKVSEYDKNYTGELCQEEINQINDLELSFNEISSLEGLQHLTSLNWLYIRNCNLNSLDVSMLQNVRSIYCYGNSIDVIDVTNNIDLLMAVSQGSCYVGLDGDTIYYHYSYSGEFDNHHYEGSLAVDINTAVVSNGQCIKHSFDDAEDTTCNYCGETIAVDDLLVIDEYSFPDPELRKYIEEEVDLNGSGKLSSLEIEVVRSLDLGNRLITKLDGIGIFTNLEYLFIYNNNIESVDLSCFPNLRALDCSGNPIQNLDVSCVPNLSDLTLFNTGITSLDVSQNPNLVRAITEGTTYDYVDNGGYSIYQVDSYFDEYTGEWYGSGYLAVGLGTAVVVNGEILKHSYSGPEDTECNCCEIPVIRDVGNLIPINSETFPDPAFRQIILKNVDLDGSGLLNSSEISQFDELYLNENVKSLEGIEYFTNLRVFNVNGCKLTELDLSNYTKLENIYLAGSGVKTLDLTGLKYFDGYINGDSGSLRGNLYSSPQVEYEVYNIYDADRDCYVRMYLYLDYDTEVTCSGVVVQHAYSSICDTTCNVCGNVRDAVSEHQILPDVNVEPTCSLPGYSGRSYCEFCGEVFVEGEEIPATGNHSYEGFPAKAATCFEDGYTEGVRCIYCLDIQSGCEVVTKLEHAIVEAPTVDSTCVDRGHTGGTYCELCETIFDDPTYLPLVAHDIQHVDYVESTCIEQGHSEGYMCTVCHMTQGNFEWLEYADHTWETVEAKEPTCYEDGYSEHQRCSVCGAVNEEYWYPALDHDWIQVPCVEPTCTSDGVAYGEYCSRCDERWGFQVIPATGHNIDIDVQGKDATCTEAGRTASYYCVYCDYVVESEEIPALGHSPVTVEGFAATCTSNGWTDGIECARCGIVIEEAEFIPALGHNEVIVEYKAPTCTEDGHQPGTHCTRCDYVTGNEVIPKLGHDIENVAEVPATCTEDGHEAGTVCRVCGLTLSGLEVLEATGHTEEEVEAVAATCTEAGCEAGRRCSVCDEILEGLEVIEPLGHDWFVTSEATEPTCTEFGHTEESVCLRCGEQGDYSVTPPLGHTEVNVPYQAPTCTEEGHDAGIYCEECGEILEGLGIIPVVPHTPVDVSRVEPTCTEDGHEAGTKCDVCGVILSGEVIPATGHNQTVIQGYPATCTSDGVTDKVTCSVCGDVLQNANVIKAHHTEQIVQGRPATCTEDGFTNSVKCSVCGEVLVEQQVIPAKGHVEETLEAVAPTCTDTGLTEGNRCSVCEEILVAQEEVEALGHTVVVDQSVAATCTTDGKTEGSHCSVCEAIIVAQVVIPAAHTPEVIPAVAATCTATGLTEGSRCSVCEDILVAQEVVQKTEHNYGSYSVINAATCISEGSMVRTCKDCGYKDYATIVKDPTNHHTVVVDALVEPTCTETGLTAGSHCEACDSVIKAQETIAKLPHSYGEFEVKTPATCVAKGLEERTCSVCGDVDSREIDIDSNNHATVVDDARVEPTCTATGLTAGSHCEACETVIEAQEEIAALGHTEQTIAGKDATCTEAGLTDGTKCSVCGEILVAQEEIAALGHTEQVIAGKDATCTEAGLTDGTKCSVCGEILVAQEEIAALGHTEQVIAGKAATCTETGLTDGTKCSVCGEILVAQEEIAALGHTEQVIAGKAATCTEAGLTDGTKCSVCGEILVAQEEIAALGHTEQTIHGKDATCTEAGLTDGTKCSVCGEILVAQEEIAALGHTEQTIAGKDATCTEAGLTDGTKCSVCGEILVAQEEIAALGHTEQVIAGKAATCTETGLTDGTKCSVCEEILKEQEEIPALGHTEQTIPGKDATCTEAGLTDGSKCSVCGEILVAQEIIPAAHTAEVIVGKEATCTEAGLSDGSKCSVCGEILVAQEEIEALGHDRVIDQRVEPTCTVEGKAEGYHCSRCDGDTLAQEIIPATGHTEVAIAAKAPTCTATGSTEGTKCSVCGVTIKAPTTIPAKGHTAVNDPAVAATVNSTGLTAGSHCSVCGTVLVAQQVVPKLTPSTPSQPTQPSNPSTPSTPSTPSQPSTPAGEQSEGGVAGFVERLYTIALGRKSDPNGKAAWINAIKNGESGAQAAKGFLFSDEFLNKPLSNEEFVKILYKTFFDREADQGGLNAWVAALERGESKQDVIMGFIDSTEWANVCLRYGIASGGTGSPNIEVEPNENIIAFATRLYTTCLKRSPDQNGLMAWARQLANLRDTGSNAAHGFFFSDEMNNNPVSNEEFVTRLYLTFMDRQPDAAGMNAWVEQLNEGVSREEVFQGFAQSAEFGAICANYGIIR